MYYVYILYSKALDRYYIGYCKDVVSRLSKHLSNHIGYTGRAKDWEVVYQEPYEDKRSAMCREREIKGWKSRRMLERLMNNSV